MCVGRKNEGWKFASRGSMPIIQDLVDLNNDSPLRQGKVFTHYGKTLEASMTRDQADFLDRSDYICAYVGHELIGVVKLVYRGDVTSILTFLPRHGTMTSGQPML